MDTAQIIRRLRFRFGDSFVRRFPETEIGAYAEEALSRYSRRTGCFTERLECSMLPDGLLILPERAIRALAVYDSSGRTLEWRSYREMIPAFGPLWYEETGREAFYAVDDFDAFNALRVVPIPPEPNFALECVVSEGNADSRVEDAVFDYVVAMLLLREFDAAALTAYDAFTRRTGRAGNSTMLPGMTQGGCFF